LRCSWRNVRVSCEFHQCCIHLASVNRIQAWLGVGASGGCTRDTLKPSLGSRQPFPTADGPVYSHPTPFTNLKHRTNKVSVNVQPHGGLPVWVTFKRRTGEPSGEKWAGYPFQAAQGRMPCEAGPGNPHIAPCSQGSGWRSADSPTQPDMMYFNSWSCHHKEPGLP